MQGRGQAKSALALVTSGISAALSAAACCGLPVLLAGMGLGTAWLIPIAATVGPYADGLILLAAFALGASLLLVARRPLSCHPGALCARPLFRAGIAAASCVGLALLLVARP